MSPFGLVRVGDAQRLINVMLLGMKDIPTARPLHFEFVNDGDLGAGSVGYSHDGSRICVYVDDGGLSCRTGGFVSMRDLCLVVLAIRHEISHLNRITLFAQRSDETMLYAQYDWEHNMVLFERGMVVRFFIEWLARFENDYYYDKTCSSNIMELDAVADSFESSYAVLSAAFPSLDCEAVMLDICEQAYISKGYLEGDVSVDSVEEFCNSIRERIISICEYKRRFVYYHPHQDSFGLFIVPRAEYHVKASDKVFELWCRDDVSGWDQVKMMACLSWVIHPELHDMMGFGNTIDWNVDGVDLKTEFSRM